MDHNEYHLLTINYLMETMQELNRCLSENSDKLINHQVNYWQDYIDLYQGLSQSSEEITDKRFRNTEWQNNISFNFIKRSYLLISKHIENAIDDAVKHEDKVVAKKLRFLMRQFVDASSPTNFAGLNPDVITKISDTYGENLLAGYKNLLEDIQQGRGLFNIRLTNQEYFKIGENIACTDGEVIFQNDIMQIIQYTPSTPEIYSYPLMIIPPWINKYYILDLQKENSLVKWLVDQGITVYMISWINPTSKQREKQFSDYMLEGPLTALNVIESITGRKKINALGYCVGGTLLGCTLAYLAQKNDSRINSATFLTTLLDFSEPGEIGVFTDEKLIYIIEKIMQQNGYLSGHIMAAIFNSLRVNDLVWSAFINQYLKGQSPKSFDLLYWNADATNIPEHVHRFCLRNMYLENNLIRPGKTTLAGLPIDFSKVTTPSYFLATQDDHIVPWMSSFNSHHHLQGKKKFVLATSGHVAGVINPPQQNKYGYWTNNKKTMDANDYLKKATFQHGSWWNDWIKWLISHSGKMHTTPEFNLKNRNVIESAPGSYVKVQLADIAFEKPK